MNQNGKCKSTNMGLAERLVSTLVGAKLVTSGLQSSPMLGLIKAGLGGMLAYRGLTGHCSLYQRMGVGRPDSAFSNPFNRELRVIDSVTINSHAGELYNHCRDMENLARLVTDGPNVRTVNSRQGQLIMSDSTCPPCALDLFITEDEPNTFIEWVVLNHEAVQHRGAIEFVPTPNNRGTIVRVDVKCRPAGGAIGALIKSLTHRGPANIIRQYLAHFKQLMETGEIASAEGPSARMRDEIARLGSTTVVPRSRLNREEYDAAAQPSVTGESS